jgi:long-chain acyl-CoA synthetase
MPNSPQALLAQFGGWKAGAIIVPMNPLYTRHELEHALNECGAETAVVLTPFYEKVKELQGCTALRRIIVSNIKEYLPAVTNLLFTLFKEEKEGHRVSIEPQDYWMQDLLHHFRHAQKPSVSVTPQDAALLIFTGGTTGTPKAAVGSHGGLYHTGKQVVSWFSPVYHPWQDVGLLNLPMFHVFGNVGALSTYLVGRLKISLLPNPRDLDDTIATIQKDRVNFMLGVPTLFAGMLAHRAVTSNEADLSSIKLCISGGAPLLTDLKKRFEQRTGCMIVEGYALTETMMGSVVTPVGGTYKAGSTGVPLPDIDLRIIDLDSGMEIQQPGSIGEILIQAPQVMLGYWNRSDETAEILRDGWLYTGDIGYLDEDGYLFIVDRKKDVIKPGGFQVWPREVEEVIARHPAVAEVGVAGVPDGRQGETVVAWIVLHADQRLSAGELRNWCKEQLAAYKIPRRVRFVESLPKSPVGKVMRRAMVEEETRTGQHDD